MDRNSSVGTLRKHKARFVQGVELQVLDHAFQCGEIVELLWVGVACE
jgi:hypothetical protein